MLIFMIGDRVSSTIRKAEQEICGLIAEAATSGEYDVVSRLSGIARRLSELAEEAAHKPLAVGGTPAPPRSGMKLRAIATPVVVTARKTSRKEGYPRFEKSRDVLVKVGWSKKERSEYVHKAPKAGVDAVVRRVVDLGKGARMFTTEDLLPVKLGSGGDELPEYQAYLCLAWLRDIGAVEQHGREGYSVFGEDLVGTVNKAWESLPAAQR
jgi:hypothetical protein